MNSRFLSFRCIFALSVLLLVCCTRESNADCCTKLNIRTDCHFLCGTGTTWKSLLNYRCYLDYGAEVAKCKVSSATDYVKLFGHRMSQTVQKGFEQLSTAVRGKLIDIQSFASATISELRSIPQDVLSRLSTIEGMTSNQLKGIVGRLRDFTTQNLKAFVNNVKLDVLFDSIREIGKENWDLEQANVFMHKAYKKYGPYVEKWTGDQISALGKLVSAIPYKDLAKISASAFDKSLEAICKASLNLDQKVSVLVSAQGAYGTISDWKSAQLNRLCDTVVAMTPEDIMRLTSRTVVDSLSFLRQQVWNRPQVKALYKKAKETMGQVQTWGVNELNNLGDILRGMDANEISKLSANSVKGALSKLGMIKWDASQLDKMAAKLKEGLGPLNTWLRNDLMNARHILLGLAPSELNQIKSSELAASILQLRGIRWSTDQAAVIFQKIKETIPIPSLRKDHVIALEGALSRLASSEVGQFGNGILLAAFPQFKHVQGIARPVLRKLIEEYKRSGNNKDLSLLGGLAAAMTRIDLNQTDVTDILASVEKLTGVEWNEAQLAELIQKARKQLGSLENTDNVDTDNPPWGFKNLMRLQKLVLGLTKDELKKFPVRGIEDAIEALGKQAGWNRGQVLSGMNRMREYLKTQNINVESLDEIDLQSLGTFLQGLTLTELKKLPTTAANTVITKLGQQTGLPEDKIRARAFWAFENLKDKTTGLLNSKEVKSLGNLVAGLGKEAFEKMSRNAFLDNLFQIVRAPAMPRDKLKDILNLAKKHYQESDVGKWIGDYWKTLGPAILALDSSEIYRINKEAFDDVIDELGKLKGFSQEQAKALILRAKHYWKASDVAFWSGQQLRKLGTLIKGLDIDDIKRLSKDAISDIMGDCDSFEGIDRDKMKAWSERVKQVFAGGDISTLATTTVREMGCVLRGLEPKDLEKLKIDIDVIDKLGNITGWDMSQLQALKTKVRTYFQSNFDRNSLISLGNILKAYTPQEIQSFSSDAFRFAAGRFGKVTGLSKEQLQALAGKAKNAWGDVSKWSRAQVAEGGNFIAGLTANDIAKIPDNDVDAIVPEAIKAMDRGQINAFSASQLSAMDQSQTTMVSAETRGQLSPPKVAALKSVEDSDPVDPDPWRCSGRTCVGCIFNLSVSSLFVCLYVSILGVRMLL